MPDEIDLNDEEEEALEVAWERLSQEARGSQKKDEGEEEE